jgi:hypothetical protein
VEDALMQLRLVQDETTILTLSSTDARTMRYSPRMPEINANSEALAGDGEAILGAPYRNVTEQVDLYWEGTRDTQIASLHKLQRLLELARQRQQTGHGARIWVHFRLASTDPWYRSEILAGRAQVEDTRYKLGLQAITPHFETAIIWTRRPYWEYAADKTGDTDALEIPLDGYDGGTTVTNNADNVIEIAGAHVIGSMPAPLRLEITNAQDSATRATTIYVARGIVGALDTTHHYDGWSVTSVNATETLLHTVSLTGEALAAWGGDFMRLMIALSGTFATDLWMRWKLYFSVTCLWEGPWINPTYWTGLRDMGAVALPPRPVYGSILSYPLDLRLYGRRASGTTSFAVTWLQILPLESWRVLVPAGYGLAYQTRVVDDGITGEVWTDGWDGGGYTTHYSGRGNPIMVEPGRDQRLYLLHHTSTGSGINNRALSVRAYYRPRKVTL